MQQAAVRVMIVLFATISLLALSGTEARAAIPSLSESLAGASEPADGFAQNAKPEPAPKKAVKPAAKGNAKPEEAQKSVEDLKKTRATADKKKKKKKVTTDEPSKEELEALEALGYVE